MSERKDPRSGGRSCCRCWGVAYVLSIGPVAIFQRDHPSAPWGRWVQVFYAPLGFACDHSKRFEHCVEVYMEWCDRR